jgi:hypothetical protein
VRGTGTPFTAAAVRDGRGWSYGIAQYGADRVDWYRIFSYAFRPAAVLTRRDLEVVGRRDPEGTEELALFPGWTILDCRFGAGYAELALSEDALTGFLSWLEAAPPGRTSPGFPDPGRPARRLPSVRRRRPGVSPPAPTARRRPLPCWRIGPG